MVVFLHHYLLNITQIQAIVDSDIKIQLLSCLPLLCVKLRITEIYAFLYFYQVLYRVFLCGFSQKFRILLGSVFYNNIVRRLVTLLFLLDALSKNNSPDIFNRLVLIHLLIPPGISAPLTKYLHLDSVHLIFVPLLKNSFLLLTFRTLNQNHQQLVSCWGTCR